MKKCPFCAEEIQDEAIVCRFCRRELATQNPGRKPPQAKKSSSAVLLLILVGSLGIGCGLYDILFAGSSGSFVYILIGVVLFVIGLFVAQQNKTH